MNDNPHSQGYDADAVVIGGADAPRCISAAAIETELRDEPEIQALSEKIMTSKIQYTRPATGKKNTAPRRKRPVPGGGHTAPRRKRPVPGGGHTAPRRKRPVPGSGHTAPQRKRPVPGSGHTAPRKKRPVPGAAMRKKAPVPAAEAFKAQTETYAIIPSDRRIRKAPKTRKKDKRKRGIASKVVLVFVISAAVFLLGAVIYEVYTMTSIVNSINYMQGGIQFEKSEVLVSQSETEQFYPHTDETKNILLCGTDIDKYGVSRTDSMIILTIDHNHQRIKMTSLMRDMYLQIPGHGQNKLNAAFTYGGGNLLLKTIYNNFGMKIDRFVCVDYAVFASVVDNLGGVEIEVEEMELEQFNKYVSGGKKNRLSKAGKYNLNGKQALSYCRIRKVGTDTARTARQRKVLREIMKKCRTLSPIKAQNILSVAAPHIATNMTRDELTSMLLEGLSSKDYETMGLRIPMDGSWKDKQVNGKWYVDVDLNKNARYMNQFIYGDNDKAQALADQQQKSDDKRTERDRNKYKNYK